MPDRGPCGHCRLKSRKAAKAAGRKPCATSTNGPSSPRAWPNAPNRMGDVRTPSKRKAARTKISPRADRAPVSAYVFAYTTKRADNKASPTVDTMTSMSSSVSNGSMRGPGPGRPGRGTRASPTPIASPIASTTAVHNAGLIPHFRSLACTPITSGFHVLHDALEDGPMGFHGGREEVHLSVPLFGGRDEAVLSEDAKMVPDRLEVQDQSPRELLGVPRLLADREQDPGPGGRPDAAPKQPPQDSFEAVHRDLRGQDRCDSCTLPRTREKGGQGLGRPVPVGRRPWALGSTSGR